LSPAGPALRAWGRGRQQCLLQCRCDVVVLTSEQSAADTAAAAVLKLVARRISIAVPFSESA